MTIRKKPRQTTRRTSIPADSDRPEDAWLPIGRMILDGRG